MATMKNSYDLLSDYEGEDLSGLLAKAVVLSQPAKKKDRKSYFSPAPAPAPAAKTVPSRQWTGRGREAGFENGMVSGVKKVQHLDHRDQLLDPSSSGGSFLQTKYCKAYKDQLESKGISTHGLTFMEDKDCPFYEFTNYASDDSYCSTDDDEDASKAGGKVVPVFYKGAYLYPKNYIPGGGSGWVKPPDERVIRVDTHSNRKGGYGALARNHEGKLLLAAAGVFEEKGGEVRDYQLQAMKRGLELGWQYFKKNPQVIIIHVRTESYFLIAVACGGCIPQNEKDRRNWKHVLDEFNSYRCKFPKFKFWFYPTSRAGNKAARWLAKLSKVVVIEPDDEGLIPKEVEDSIPYHQLKDIIAYDAKVEKYFPGKVV